MSKYKLIKEYPGSPKLGTEAKKIEEFYFYLSNLSPTISPERIENSPEYWQKIEEKEYEILSYQHQVGTITFDSELPNSVYYRIYSVRRKSDGEIFTIGDKIRGYKNTGIKSIELTPYGLRIITDANGDGCVTSKLSWELSSCIKEKPILFTSEDSKEIREGDNYWYLNTIGSNLRTPWKVCESRTNPGARIDISNKDTKRFSTKEAADSWVVENKPVLSYKEVIEYIQVTAKTNPAKLLVSDLGLKKLVKSKLNK